MQQQRSPIDKFLDDMEEAGWKRIRRDSSKYDRRHFFVRNNLPSRDEVLIDGTQVTLHGAFYDLVNADHLARVRKELLAPATTPRGRILAMAYIEAYGGIPGEDHKQWVLDQVARALMNCPAVTTSGVDAQGREYSYLAQGESESYAKWVTRMRGKFDPEEEVYEYGDWDTGSAP